jgi:hypothetical protein
MRPPGFSDTFTAKGCKEKSESLCLLLQVKRHFVRFIHADKQEAEMWLEYNGTPLKW